MAWKVNNWYFKLWLCCCLSFAGTVLYAIDSLTWQSFERRAVLEEVFDKEQWAKLRSEMGFKIAEKPSQKEALKNNSKLEYQEPQDNDNTIYYVLFGALIIFIAFLIYGAFFSKTPMQNLSRQTRNYKSEVDNITTFDTKAAIKESIKQEDYNESIRHNFLDVLKNLYSKGLIEWSKDKPSIIYLQELRRNAPHLSEDFAEIAQIFDFIWYGNKPITSEQYRIAAPYFNNFLAKIK